MNPLLKKILPHLAATAIFLGLCTIYFLPQLQGKVVRQGDVLQYLGMSQEVREFKAETGKESLWTNSMFGGMPTYQINTVYAGNNLRFIDRVARLDIRHPIGRFFIAMLGFYILMICLGVNHWLSIIGAVAFGFTTNNFLLYEAGHMTKLKSISHLPLTIAGLLLAYRKKYLLGALLFALGLGLNVYSNHIQMTYYFLLTLILFGIAQLLHSIRNNELPHFLKATGVLTVAGLLALGSAASNLWITYEYSKDTMRGKPILEQSATLAAERPQSSSETDGLAWDYAMAWSNGLIDVFASFIPGVAGGGSQEKIGENAAIRKAPDWGRIVQQGNIAPLYWGSLPFTSGPIYFGAGIFLFFLMGLFLVKGPVKWWLALGTLLTILLSMGKNLEAFNEFFYYYVPLYNKFRTPNSVLSVTGLLINEEALANISRTWREPWVPR